MVVFDLLKSAQMISRKFWVTGKLWQFHFVFLPHWTKLRCWQLCFAVCALRKVSKKKTARFFYLLFDKSPKAWALWRTFDVPGRLPALKMSSFHDSVARFRSSGVGVAIAQNIFQRKMWEKVSVKLNCFENNGRRLVKIARSLSKFWIINIIFVFLHRNLISLVKMKMCSLSQFKMMRYFCKYNQIFNFDSKNLP